MDDTSPLPPTPLLKPTYSISDAGDANLHWCVLVLYGNTVEILCFYT